MSECPYCGDTLHSFVEELEDSSMIHVVICPTCYRFHSSQFIRTSAMSRRVRNLRLSKIAGATPLLNVKEGWLNYD